MSYPTPPSSGKSLYRAENDKIIAGVCAGLARYFGIDPTLVRIGLVLFTLLGGSGVLAYLLLWLFMPNAQGQRAATPLVILLVFFIGIPAMCFLLTLPFRIFF